MERKPLRGQKKTPKNKLSIKMIIAKHYKFLLLILSFVLGVAFPNVVAFQGIATGILIVILSIVIAKIFSVIDSALLKWATPITVTTKVDDLDSVIDSPEKLVAIAKMMASLRSEDEFFVDRENESEVK